MSAVTVIGGGLAGCEAAWALAERGCAVRLCEMKPQRYSPAHHSPALAELVCSNSLKAMRPETASGLLKAEMSLLGSLLLPAAQSVAVPAGGALAVDRDAFAAAVTAKIAAHPRITLVREEITELPADGVVIVATGPLTSDALAAAVAAKVGRGALSFYDAAAPIVTAESVDLTRAFWGARYDRGEADYLNCPLEKDEYAAFWQALTTARRAERKAFDEPVCVYEGCMPVEIMAQRGEETLRHGPMRPVGLRDPSTGRRPWALVQLRSENAERTLFNLVGFQTNLAFPEQRRVFGLIPALKNAEYARYGVMHRNTFLDSPRLLSPSLSLRAEPRLFFAGQMTGVEGYLESAATGIIAGVNAARFLEGLPAFVPPRESILGSLLAYISDAQVTRFQPMGSNMGLLPPLENKVRDKKQRYALLAERSLSMLANTIKEAQLNDFIDVKG